jgi:hypothetical protein
VKACLVKCAVLPMASLQHSTVVRPAESVKSFHTQNASVDTSGVVTMLAARVIFILTVLFHETFPTQRGTL